MTRNKKRNRGKNPQAQAGTVSDSKPPKQEKTKLQEFASKAVQEAEIKRGRGTILDKVNKKIQQRKKKESRLQTKIELARIKNQSQNPWQSPQTQVKLLASFRYLYSTVVRCMAEFPCSVRFEVFNVSFLSLY